MKTKIPRVLITVRGGSIEDVTTDAPVEVLIYDWDNISQAEGMESAGEFPAEFSTSIGLRKFDKLKREQDALVAEELQEQEDALKKEDR